MPCTTPTGKKVAEAIRSGRQPLDAQNTMVQSRAAYADALVRYRVALATIQTLTGSF
jgi:outer membrane protein TolC